MSHPIKVCAVAYRKGVDEKRRNGHKKKCPYGQTKLELQHWWLAGFNDAKQGTVDKIMYESGLRNEL